MRQGDEQDGQDPLAGLPQTRNGAFTPAGQVEQWGKIADGLAVSRRGWKRVVVLVGAAALGLLVAVLALMALVGR